MGIVKQVDYAYASSDHAERFGRGTTGCWIVEVGVEGEVLEPVRCFDSESDAVRHAESLALPWSRCTQYLRERKAEIRRERWDGRVKCQAPTPRGASRWVSFTGATVFDFGKGANTMMDCQCKACRSARKQSIKEHMALNRGR